MDFNKDAPVTLHYRGVNTSLYGSLSHQATHSLEQAIWLKITGQTNAARDIWENELKTYRHIPVVAIEFADFEFESGRWGQAWRILDTALKAPRALDGKKNNGSLDLDVDLDLPEYRLMALTWAMLGVRHRGDLDSAAIEIERTRQWLWEKRVDDYTDVEVFL